MNVEATAPSSRLRHYIYLQTAFLALLTWYLSGGFYHDDSYISLRYARNLLDGYGMTWNPGEHVEGYTNFLFILLTALLGALGIDLVLASRLVSFLSFFGLLAVFAWYMKLFYRDKPQSLESLIGVSLIGSSVPLLAWCIGGLEGNLFALYLAGGICTALRLLQGEVSRRYAILSGLSFALATLTRPEGAMLFGLTGAFLLAARVRLSLLIAMAAAYAVIFIPYMAWRLAYFDEWLPNTYYAKSYGIDPAFKWIAGLFYLLQYAFMPPLLILFVTGLLIIAAVKRKWNASLTYLTLCALLFIAYIASVGGDHMGYFRFMVPVVPILALLVYHGGSALREAGKERIFRDIASSLLFFSVFQLGLVQERGYSTGALSGLAVADYVNQQWPKGSLIAVNPAGALPYAAHDFRYIDMLGLLDKQIARRQITELRAEGQRAVGHLKGDGGYVLSRKPDYIIFGMAWGADKPHFLSDLEISEHPDFNNYEKVEAFITPPAEVMDQLRELSEESETKLLNAENQLRFVYYQRRNTSTAQ